MLILEVTTGLERVYSTWIIIIIIIIIIITCLFPFLIVSAIYIRIT